MTSVIDLIHDYIFNDEHTEEELEVATDFVAEAWRRSPYNEEDLSLEEVNDQSWATDFLIQCDEKSKQILFEEAVKVYAESLTKSE